MGAVISSSLGPQTARGPPACKSVYKCPSFNSHIPPARLYRGGTQERTRLDVSVTEPCLRNCIAQLCNQADFGLNCTVQYLCFKRLCHRLEPAENGSIRQVQITILGASSLKNFYLSLFTNENIYFENFYDEQRKFTNESYSRSHESVPVYCSTYLQFGASYDPEAGGIRKRGIPGCSW